MASAPADADPAAPVPTAKDSASPPVAVTVPRAWPGDEHTTVLAELPDSCGVRGVQDGSVYITTSNRTSHNLHRVPIGGGAPVLVHSSPPAASTYRVGHGRVVIFRHLEHRLGTLHLLSPEDGKETLLEERARESSWTIAPSGVYWADVSYEAPEIFHVPFSGGERKSIEKVRQLVDKDWIFDLTERDGDLYFVTRRTRNTGTFVRNCDEVRGGPAGRSRTLRRWSGADCTQRDMVAEPTVSARHLYYWRDDAFQRVPRGGGKEELLLPTSGRPQASWSDDRVLIWIEARGLIRQRLEPGAKPEMIGDRATVLQGLSVAGDRVYWARYGESCLVMSRRLDAPAIRTTGDR